MALLWGVVAAIVAMVTLARPWAFPVDVGGRWDGPYLDGFYGYERNDEGRFRWSQPEGEVYLPGAGRLAALELRAHGGPEGKTLRISGAGMNGAIGLRPGWQRVRLLPRPEPWSGDVRFTVSTAPQMDSDRRQLGFVLDSMLLLGRVDSPPLGQGLLLGLSVACGSALAGWGMRRLWVAALAGLLLTMGMAYVLGNGGGAWRLYLTDYTGRLALVLGCCLLVGLLAERAWRWLDSRGLVRIGSSGRRALAAVVALAFLLRFGALAYPLNFPSDLRFNLGRAWMVRDGKFLELFLPNAGLTPVQWQSDITVPRTPYYYLLISPVTFLPGDGPELALMGISSLVDALAVGLVGLLVFSAGAGRRAALVAAFLVAAQAFSLVVVTSWGIYTTLLGQCLALLAVWLWQRGQRSGVRGQGSGGGGQGSEVRGERVEVAGLESRTSHLTPHTSHLASLAMMAAFLSHPATLLLLGATWGLLVGLLFVQRDGAWRPTLRIGLLASFGALVLYYGWHLPELVRRSLPVVFTALGGGRPLNTESRVEAMGQGPSLLWAQLFEMYGFWLLGAAAVGAALLASRVLAGGASRRVRSLGVLLLAWGLIYPPFALADARVTLNYKHVLFMLPLIAVLTSLFYGGLLRRRWGRAVVWSLLALVLWQGMDLVIYKVMYAYISLR